MFLALFIIITYKEKRGKNLRKCRTEAFSVYILLGEDRAEREAQHSIEFFSEFLYYFLELAKDFF